jgi:muramoyltetrapeptide carboxypeptidase
MRVRVEAPSSPFPADKLAAGVERLRAAGVDVDDPSGVLRGRHAYLNGDDDLRRRSLEEALHSDVDVVWLARGGYGLTRIVSRLSLPSKGPIVIGFSDASALFAQAAGTGLRCVHGPLVTSLAGEPEHTFRHALDVLERRAKNASFDVTVEPPDVDVDGWLFAANLCVLAHLAGTPSSPNLDGAILVLEEVGERPYRIDRALTQLKESGALAGVRAIVVGHLTGCEEPGAPSPQSTRDAPPRALDVFRERVASMHIPFAHGLQVGHEPPNVALPLGVRARVGGGKLTLLEDLP